MNPKTIARATSTAKKAAYFDGSWADYRTHARKGVAVLGEVTDPGGVVGLGATASKNGFNHPIGVAAPMFHHAAARLRREGRWGEHDITEETLTGVIFVADRGNNRVKMMQSTIGRHDEVSLHITSAAQVPHLHALIASNRSSMHHINVCPYACTRVIWTP